MRRFLPFLLCLSAVACDKSGEEVSREAERVAVVAPPSTSELAQLPPEARPKALSSAANAFGLDLWVELTKTSSGNLVISPTSLSGALTMTYAGARGTTAREMAQALHLETGEARPETATARRESDGIRQESNNAHHEADGTQLPSRATAVATGWQSLLASLTLPGRSIELRIANRLFGEKTAAFEQPYLELGRARFGAPLELLDFKTDSEISRGTINRWVAEATQRKIPELLPTNALNKTTRLVLVDALYFLADWSDPFPKHLTQKADFFLLSKAKANVQMMRRMGSYRYFSESGRLSGNGSDAAGPGANPQGTAGPGASTSDKAGPGANPRGTAGPGASTSDKARPGASTSDKAGPGANPRGAVSVLELPYGDGDATMLIVLPDSVDGLGALDQSLTLARIEHWLAKLRPTEIDVRLPRFILKPSGISLSPLLKRLGMTAAFDRQQADFTGIGQPKDPFERLYLRDSFHQAIVKVDEKGTEAAAATTVIGAAAGGFPKMVEFNADHPFLFLILDKPTGLILFLGRVVDPSKS